jgi:large subunit ribosomal protein L29
MKTNKKIDLHEQSSEELQKMLKDARGELFTTRLDHVRGKVKNVRSIRALRKTIAQVSSVIRGKELAAYGKSA